MKRIWIGIGLFCAAALLVTGCGRETADPQLRDFADPRLRAFHERLCAEDDAQDGAEGGAADCAWAMDVSATVSGTTLSVREVVGSERRVSLLIEVTPPVDAASVLPAAFRCKAGHIAQTGQDFPQIDRTVSGLPGPGSAVVESIDGEPGLFLASFSCGAALEGRELTLVFDDLQALDAQGERIAARPGPFLLRWTAEKA